MLYFTLYWRFLCGASFIVVVFDAGFCISGCHVCSFQMGALCDEICTTKATYKHAYFYIMYDELYFWACTERALCKYLAQSAYAVCLIVQ